MADAGGPFVPGPALPQLGVVRFGGQPGQRLMAKARRIGLTHLAITDHERIDGALRARDLAPEAPDRHRGRGGPVRRRRPHRAVPRARGGARACPRPRRPRPSTSRAAWSACRIRSTGSARRVAARPPRQQRTPRCAGRGRGLRRDPQRPRLSATPTRSRPRLRRVPRPARDRVLGRPQRDGAGHGPDGRAGRSLTAR